MPHLLGYARVSTADQHPDLQLDALRAAGSYPIFADTASSALDGRPGLVAGRQRRDGVVTALEAEGLLRELRQAHCVLVSVSVEALELTGEPGEQPQG